jgi:hypothetical protein
VTLLEYRDSYWRRFLSRTQLSLGTTKGSSEDDKSARVAVGLRFTLFDFGDAKLDPSIDTAFETIATATINRIENQQNMITDKHEQLVLDRLAAEADGDNAEVQKLDARIEAVKAELEALEDQAEKSFIKAWEATLKEHEKGVWNASSATLGVAPVFFSEEGTYGDLKSEGYAVYGTLAYGFDRFRPRTADTRENLSWFGKNAQVLLHARYRENDMEALGTETAAVAGSDGFRKQDTTIFGGKIRVQGPKIWSSGGGDLVFSLEGSNVQKDFADGGSENVTRYAGGFEVKPLKNSGFTLKGVVGGQSGGSDDDSGFVVATLNWALD